MRCAGQENGETEAKGGCVDYPRLQDYRKKTVYNKKPGLQTSHRELRNGSFAGLKGDDGLHPALPILPQISCWVPAPVGYADKAPNSKGLYEVGKGTAGNQVSL